MKTPLTAVLDVALEIIKWFNNHSGALAILQKQQQVQYGCVLALIRPAPTRWTAHYHSSNRLLQVEQAMRICVLNSKHELIAAGSKEAAQIEKSCGLLVQIEHPDFWTSLAM